MQNSENRINKKEMATHSTKRLDVLSSLFRRIVIGIVPLTQANFYV